MAKVTYHPDNEMPEKTEQFGHSFESGKPVEVTEARYLRKFAGHPFFSVDDADDELKRAAKADNLAKARAAKAAKSAM